MEILETWQNKRGEAFAIVRHPTRPHNQEGSRPYAAMFELDGELFDFGGGPGFNIAEFDTLDEARAFLLTGFQHEEENPEIFLQMLEVRPALMRRPADA
jgi:hypothetical protein